jgi:hypothetical protein
MLIEISIGEIIDKLSILLIKKSKIEDQEKQVYINEELENILKCLKKSKIKYKKYLKKITKINLKLWEINDKRKLMIKEKNKGKKFINMSIKESLLNDKRFLIKKEINEKFQSKIKEQKSYE